MLGPAIDEERGDEEQLQPVRMLERVVEPADRVAVLVAVLRHRVVVRFAGLEDDLRRGDLDGVEDAARAPPALEQGHFRLVLIDARNGVSVFGQARTEHQADVPCSDDGDFHFTIRY